MEKYNIYKSVDSSDLLKRHCDTKLSLRKKKVQDIISSIKMKISENLEELNENLIPNELKLDEKQQNTVFFEFCAETFMNAYLDPNNSIELILYGLRVLRKFTQRLTKDDLISLGFILKIITCTGFINILCNYLDHIKLSIKVRF